MAFYQAEASNYPPVTNPSAEKGTSCIYLNLDDVQLPASALYDGIEPPSLVAVQPERTTQRVHAPKIKHRKMNRTALVTISLVVTALLVTILGVQIWGNRRLEGILTDMPNDRVHECVVKAGTVGGGPFDDYFIHGIITEVEVKISSGRLVGFRVRYGDKFTDWRGMNTGRIQRFTLRKNEAITGLHMFVGNYLPRGIIGLGIETSQGRNTFYGTNKTNVISVATGMTNGAVYFSGKSGSVIDSLAIHYPGCNKVRYK